MSTNQAFSEPVQYKRSNLCVVTDAMVMKVLIDPNANKAHGVKFVRSSHIAVVRVMKEVILCAGVINSPQILQLPEVGPSGCLDSFGISVIKNLKVGYNFKDPFLPTPFVNMKLQNIATVPNSLQNFLEDVKKYEKFRNGSFRPSRSDCLHINFSCHKRYTRHQFCVLFFIQRRIK
jgi:choline dehydrogenase-like flavoprotein